MSVLPEPGTTKQPAHRWRRLWLFVACLLLMAAGPVTARAHTELERADPPIDGVVVVPPDWIELVFTGEVAATDPAPSLQIFDLEGEPQPVQLLPLDDDRRTVTAEIGQLDAGTYTVAWTVQSAADGHILSGTYGFRVGGGVPPGMATTAGETPAAWAVATRWLTFLGIAAALAGLLVDRAVFGASGRPRPYRRRHALFILAGAFVALLASLAEPLLQALDAPEGVELDVASAIAGLPGAWWLRPFGLGITAVLGVLLVARWGDRVSWPVAQVGAAGCLLALAGLSLTSHAASEESWKAVALLSNFIHQVAVALWTGGLALLMVWWPSRHAATGDVTVVRRFSTLALPLVAVALLTGVVNTGFMFPLVEGIERYGVAPDAVATLWTADYGVVLLVKLLLLLVPLGLAVLHRAAIARAVGAARRRAGPAIGRTLRIESATVAAVVLAGSVLALSAPPQLERPPLDEVVLAAPAPTAGGAMTVVHLNLDPAEPGENRVRVQLTDPYGDPLAEPPPAVDLEVASLDHDGVHHSVEAPLTDPATATYIAEGVTFGPNGWWGITTAIPQEGQESTRATTYLLLPDPNIHGFDAPPERETSTEAEALFARGTEQMTSWSSVRSTERIASGSDAIAILERAVTTGRAEQPPAQIIAVVYTAGFAPLASGDPPAPPEFLSSYQVTVGDQGWRLGPDGEWLEAPPTRASFPAEWDNTYVGAEDFRLGVTDEIEGEPVQVVTFYLPEQGATAEAWFAWWVGIESGNVYRVAMVAQAHYMLLEYSDIDEPIRIEAPATGEDAEA